MQVKWHEVRLASTVESEFEASPVNVDFYCRAILLADSCVKELFVSVT